MIVGIVVFATAMIVAGVVTARLRKDFEPYGLAAWPYILLAFAPLVGVIFYLSAGLPERVFLIISDSSSVALFGLMFFVAARYLWKQGGPK